MIRLKKQFTLIELLTSVAVLAILISLLQPSLQNTLKTAKGVLCSNNLKGIGAAMANYTYDYTRFTPYFNHRVSSRKRGAFLVTYDDMLGQSYDGRDLTPEQVDATYLTQGSIGEETNLYLCPLDNVDHRLKEENIPYQQRTYSINSYGSSGGSNVPESQRKGIAGTIYGKPSQPWSALSTSISHPAQTILTAERPGLGFLGGGWNRHIPNITWQDGIIYETSFGWDPLKNIRYHNAGYNYLMVDGHIENLTPEETMSEGGTFNNPKGLWSSKK